MSWLLWIPAILLGLAGVVTLAGACLPRRHVVSRTLQLGRKPAEVWAAITDFPGQTAWRQGLTGVERLADREGRQVWRESFGRQRVSLETAVAVPPAQLVRAIADERGPFRGSWEFQISPAPEGCWVHLTERGEVPNPFFRFVSRYVLGHAAFLEQYLRDLAGRFRETPVLE